MRKLSPPKAITHALNSVWTYRAVAARIAFPWLPALIACAIAQIYAGPPDPAAQELTAAALVQIATSVRDADRRLRHVGELAPFHPDR